MKKVILDVDTGIDDALAIAYLLAQKDVEVLGITTGFGNVLADAAYENTIRILHLLNRDDIKTFRGADYPLGENSFERNPINVRIHGVNGIGEVELERPQIKEESMRSFEFIAECAEKYGKELTIITVGALTNLVLAIEKNEQAIRNVGSIVMMGGALTVRGNCNNYAEANYLRDPKATAQFFKYNIPSTMIGLDVTLRTVITEKDADRLMHIENKAAKAIVDMMRYYYTNEGDSTKELSGCLHDPLGVEAALNPDIITQYLECDLMAEEEGESIGRVVIDPDTLIGGAEINKVALKVKADEFIEKFVNSLCDLLTDL